MPLSLRAPVRALFLGAAVIEGLFVYTRIARGDVTKLAPIEVTAPAENEESTDTTLGAEARRASAPDAARDTASLLQDSPGVDGAQAGAIASLPVVHGMADDRVRVDVDGVGLVAACPNHMNSPLSYIDPSKVGRVVVYAGVTPVSVGGDSLGGSIQVESREPEFARGTRGYRVGGEFGGFYRSNGHATGYHFRALGGTSWLFGEYTESWSQADNYLAGGSFKPGNPSLAGNQVGSSAYDGAINRSVRLAGRYRQHTVVADLSQQRVDFEGFPNQRMDLTRNLNSVASVRYVGRQRWGDLKLMTSYQDTRHGMDMGPDRFAYGTGMPMQSKAKTRGAGVQANVLITEHHTIRTGLEYHYHTLYDWWPAVGGAMGPNAFWNVDFGQRQRFGFFSEWETEWSPRLTTNAGVRVESVMTNAGPVQGYDNGLRGLWGDDAARFNEAPRKREDLNWDAALLLRHTPGPTVYLDAAYGRKTRSPNLYQRYPWATNPMAALMNNTVGDGNGYIGNVDLKPEVSHTMSLGGNWHDAEQKRWEVQSSTYYSYVPDYIDARRCNIGQCSAENLTREHGFVLLQYVNRRARLFGWDLAGKLVIYESPRYGRFSSTGQAGYIYGENLTAHDALYHVSPLHGNAALWYEHRGWTASSEWVGVAAKRRISAVRNELKTEGYWLLHLRLSYRWRFLRADLSVENVLNRFYQQPLGGAYVGQGATMTTNGVPWGIAVPGPGRSCNTALTLSY